VSDDEPHEIHSFDLGMWKDPPVWISTKVEVPSDGRAVLIYIPHGEYYIATYGIVDQGVCGWWPSSNPYAAALRVDQVTHWMTLPDKPGGA
jgi:hypothetical protein